MAVSDKQKQYANKYLTEKVEEFKVRVPMGTKKQIQEYAKSRNLSVNKLILQLLQNESGISLLEEPKSGMSLE